MSNVNDNNLDDLLRRAAERYPLRTDSADWEKLASDLERDPSLILPPVNAEDRRRRRRFFWLFFLLPLAGAGYYVWHGTGKSSLAQHTTEKTTPVKEDEKTPAANGSSGEEKTVPATKSADRVVGNKTTQAGTNVPTSTIGTKGAIGTKGSIGTKGTKNTTVPASIPVPSGKVDPVNTDKKAGQTAKASNKKGTNKKTKSEKIFGDEENDKVTGKTIKASFAEAELRLAGGNINRASTKGIVAINFPVKSKNTDSLAKPAKKDKIRTQKPKPSFYVGIMGSPDLSSVKFQSVNNLGSSFGVLLGYSFNSRWAVETGLYYDRKKYYTDGEYFSKAINHQLAYVDQLKVKGVCSMWEIPINVRYNFSSGEKIKWFATAGLSTYLMSREKYYCTGYWSGAPWAKEWDHPVSYHSLFSVINLSAGYEQKIGKIGNLRLEPYLRIPTSGIGTGNLSIMSAGLNIGITRKIW